MRLAQQEVVTELGISSLSGKLLKEILQEAVQSVHDVLHVDYVSILEYIPSEKKMLFRAAVGWKKDVVVDKTRVDAGKGSHAGYTMWKKRPVIIKNIAAEKRFRIPPPLADYPAKSGISCVIYGKETPYGVLTAHSQKSRAFMKEDITFLQSIANLLALTIERKKKQKDLEQALIELYRLKYALDQSSIVSITDKEGIIKYVNEKFFEMSKYSPEELIGHTHRVINSGFHPRAFFVNLWNTIKSGKVWHGEIRNRAKDGNYFWVDTTVTPLLNEKGEIEEFISIRNDITQRKQLEVQKDDFIGIASHELKTPITSLKAYTQVMENRFVKAGDIESATLLSKMDMQLDKLTNLISDLLDATKIQKGKLQFQESYFDFNELVAEIVEEMQRTTSKHTLVKEFGKSKTVHADRERIGQVLTNFLSNAIKYSPASKKIIVKTWSDKKTMSAHIQDFGIGIPADMRQHVFERFFRVKGRYQESFPGLGLGLYISSEIIKRHHGKIWLKIKKGSTFGFTIPLEVTI